MGVVSGVVYDGRKTPFEAILKHCKGQPYPILELPKDGDSAALRDQLQSMMPTRKQEIGDYGDDGGRPAKK